MMIRNSSTDYNVSAIKHTNQFFAFTEHFYSIVWDNVHVHTAARLFAVTTGIDPLGEERSVKYVVTPLCRICVSTRGDTSVLTELCTG